MAPFATSRRPSSVSDSPAVPIQASGLARRRSVVGGAQPHQQHRRRLLAPGSIARRQRPAQQRGEGFLAPGEAIVSPGLGDRRQVALGQRNAHLPIIAIVGHRAGADRVDQAIPVPNKALLLTPHGLGAATIDVDVAAVLEGKLLPAGFGRQRHVDATAVLVLPGIERRDLARRALVGLFRLFRNERSYGRAFTVGHGRRRSGRVGDGRAVRWDHNGFVCQIVHIEGNVCERPRTVTNVASSDPGSVLLEAMRSTTSAASAMRVDTTRPLSTSIRAGRSRERISTGRRALRHRKRRPGPTPRSRPGSAVSTCDGRGGREGSGRWDSRLRRAARR